MKALVVSYVDGITDEIIQVLKRHDEFIEVTDVKDIRNARQKILREKYDIMVIDVMVQENNFRCVGPLLQPALEFLELCVKLNEENRPKKVFALFDEEETGERGKAEVKNMGYYVANFKFSLMQWRTELLDYLKK